MTHPECNHHGPVTDDHEWVDFGDGPFVANKAALPLLRALHAAGLRTRSHHIAEDASAFVCILLDPGVEVSVRAVHESSATRTKYNGAFEVCLSWRGPKTGGNSEPEAPASA